MSHKLYASIQIPDGTMVYNCQTQEATPFRTGSPRVFASRPCRANGDPTNNKWYFSYINKAHYVFASEVGAVDDLKVGKEGHCCPRCGAKVIKTYDGDDTGKMIGTQYKHCDDCNWMWAEKVFNPRPLANAVFVLVLFIGARLTGTDAGWKYFAIIFSVALYIRSGVATFEGELRNGSHELRRLQEMRDVDLLKELRKLQDGAR